MNKLVVLSITMLMVGNNAQAADTLYSKAVGFMKSGQFVAGAAAGFALGRASHKPASSAGNAAADVKIASQAAVVASLDPVAQIPAAVALLFAARRASPAVSVASKSPATMTGGLKSPVATGENLALLNELLASKGITYIGGQVEASDEVQLVALDAKTDKAFVQFYVSARGLTLGHIKAAQTMLCDRTGFAEQYLELEGGAAAHTLSRTADALAASVGGMTVGAHQLLAAAPGTAVTSLASSLTATAPASTATAASVSAVQQ